MEYDVAILGGGIAGLGVARELAERGKRVVVLEARQLGQATSNNTLRIIHGGFRYLQQCDLPRMIKSLGDQRDLLQEVPEALRTLPCLMPLNRFGVKSALPVGAASLFYGAALRLLRSSVPAPRIISRNETQSRVPFLSGRVPHGALLWYDVVMERPELIVAYLHDRIQRRAGMLYENAEVTGIVKRGDGWSIATSIGLEVRSRIVVSTLGPWVNTLSVNGGPTEGFRVFWCKGVNLTVSAPIDAEHAIGIESADGRLFFVVPRNAGSAIGTWYQPVDEISHHPTVSVEETKAYIAEFNQAIGEDVYQLDHIIASDVGILPMHRVGAKGPELIGNERYKVKDQFVEVLSTKYTTFRTQGRKVAKIITRL